MNTHVKKLGRKNCYAYPYLVGRIVKAVESANPAFTISELVGICELVGVRRFVELCTQAYNNEHGWVGA